jgi:hypothetical protein
VNLVRGNLIIVLELLIIAFITIFPIPSRAQDVIRGEFSLSQEVRWGNSVLPMGDYVYFVDSTHWPAAVRVEQKRGGFTGMFIPQTLLRPGKQGSTGIVLRSVGNDTYVKSLQLQELGAELDFSAPGADSEVRTADSLDAHATGVSTPSSSSGFSGASEYITILNPTHEKVSPEEVEKVYLGACEAVEREFNRTSPIRPRLILRLGTGTNVLRYPMLEIQLKKWDEYRFADAVVDLALHAMLPPEEKVRLGDTAVHEAGATVNICELKACVN